MARRVLVVLAGVGCGLVLSACDNSSSKPPATKPPAAGTPKPAAPAPADKPAAPAPTEKPAEKPAGH